MMPQRLIYATKDLRNAIANNDVVFDTRFRTGNINKQVGNAISNAAVVKGLSHMHRSLQIPLFLFSISLRSFINFLFGIYFD